MLVGRKKLLFQLFLILLSVLFGFSCLAFVSHTFPWTQDTWRKNSQRALSFSVIPVRRKMNWQLYGDQELENVFFRNDFTDIRVEKHTFLKTVSHSFQEDLLNGIPLKCPIGGACSEDELLSKKYERFLKTLEVYASYHNTLGKYRTKRTLVWWCSMQEFCGGLGDRIQGITYALLLAMLSRRRLLIVWETDLEDGFLHPHMINWKDKMISNLLNKHAKGLIGSVDFIDPYRFSFQSIIGESGKLEIDASEDDMAYYLRIIGSNETNVIVSTNLEPSSLLDGERNGNNPRWLVDGLQWHGLSHLSNGELDDVMGLVFRYLFKLDDAVLEEMSAAAEVLGLNHSPYVSVHVRTGFAGMPAYEELIHHPKLQQNDSDWKLALHSAVKASDELPGMNMTYIFLATDSKLVKEMALSKYGMRIRTLRNVLVHMDRLQKEPHSLSAKEKEGLMVMLVEFFLLAQGEVLVRGESMFSRIAGLLCGLHGRSMIMKKIDNCS